MGEVGDTRPARGRGVVVAVGLLAALPVIVSTIRALAVGWIPIGDDAIIASRAYDVFTTHPPLLGQYSAATGDGTAVHSLGPLLYWLLAIPTRLGPWALVVTAGVVNVASVMGVVALARRRGGDVLMLVVGAAVAAMCFSFVPDSLHDIWNPSIALMPFALLVFAGWSVACGEHRLLPLMAVLASFVVQCHLTFVLPTLGIVAIALTGLLVGRGGAPVPGLRRSAVVAGVLALVCWSAPLVEQVIHRPGNFVQVARAALDDRGKLGAEAGTRTVVRAVGVPPNWLERAGRPPSVLEDLQTDPALLSTIAAVAVLALLAVIGVVALRRRARDVAAAAGIALVLPLTLGMVAASTPTEDGLFISIGYTLRWGSLAGMFAWLVCLWGGVSLLRPAWRRRDLHGRGPLLAGAAAVAVVAVVVSAATRADVFEPRYDPANALVDAIEGQNEGRPATVRSPLRHFDLQAAAAYALRREGEVRVPPFDRQLGRRYKPQAGDDGPVVGIDVRDPGRGAREVARVPDNSIEEDPPDRPPRRLTITVAPPR